MLKHGTNLIGLDLKPRRKGPAPRRNRFSKPKSRWIVPAIIALANLLFIVVGWIR